MSSGALVVVATPIGNLGDMTPRAAEALTSADVIACEDTRRTRKLLAHLGARSPRLIRVDDHTESGRVGDIVELIGAGQRTALVTDAGTPGVADPGYRLIRAVLAAGLPVEVLPGASALLAALIASGLPSDRFCFEGFLPRKGRARQDRLAALATEIRTTVIYESPHRVAATVDELADVLGPERPVAVCRELTKLFEEVRRGSLGEAVEWLASSAPRGEYVVVLGGAAPAVGVSDEQIATAVALRLAAGATRRDAAAAVSTELGVSHRRAYRATIGVE